MSAVLGYEHYGYLPERILSCREYEMALTEEFPPTDRFTVVNYTYSDYRRSPLNTNGRMDEAFRKAEKAKLLQEALDI